MPENDPHTHCHRNRASERALTSVLPFAATDKTIEQLCAVRLSVRAAGSLLVESTNRFVAGRYTVGVQSEGFEPALIPTKGVKTLIASLKDVDAPAPVTLTHSEMFLSLSVYGGSVMAGVPTIKDDFPKIEHLIPDVSEAIPTEYVGVDPKRLALFSKVIGEHKNTPMRLTFFGSLKPVRVDIGERFTGIVMPIKMGV